MLFPRLELLRLHKFRNRDFDTAAHTGNDMGMERHLRKAKAYFDEHLDELLKKFPGEYVAIIGRGVVFSHNLPLARRVGPLISGGPGG